MIAYLDERPLNTIPRQSSFPVSELRDNLDSEILLQVSISVEDTDCEVYGLTEDGYIDYPFETVVNEKADGTTGYTVLVELTPLALGLQILSNNTVARIPTPLIGDTTILHELAVGDLVLLQQSLAILSE